MRKLLFFGLALTCALGTLWPSSVLAERRIALVVGNSHYKSSNLVLANPTNDAVDVTAVLRAIGFEVVEASDVSKREFDAALLKFSRLTVGADSALFFYAGHAMQYLGRNYLMPVDAELEDEMSIRYQMVAMEDVRAALDHASGVKIMILDACRNNPLAERLARASGQNRSIGSVRGLARIDKTQGMVVAYATAADAVAMDGSGRNSPFTASLVARLSEPGLEIEMMFRRITADVNVKTQGRQRPETYISLLSEYYLNQLDQVAWERIKDTTEPAALRDFVIRFPSSPRLLQAQQRLASLQAEAAIAAATKPPPPAPRPDEVTWGFLKENKDTSSLKRFIEEFPNSPRRADAQRRLAALEAEAAAKREPPPPPAPKPDEMTWSFLKDNKDTSALKRFIEEFPKSPRRADAERRLAALEAEAAAKREPPPPPTPKPDEITWGVLKDNKDLSALKRFLEEFPNSPRRADAQRRLAALEAEAAAKREPPPPPAPKPDEMTWSFLKDNKDTSALKRFIEEFPKSPRRADAERRLAALETEAAAKREPPPLSPKPDQVAWEFLKNSSDRTVLARFVEEFPDSPLRAAAQQRLALLNNVSPEGPTQSPAPAIDSGEAARLIKLELKRVGCFNGVIDGEFGNSSRAALRHFAKLAVVNLPETELSPETLNVIRRFEKRICPLICAKGEHVDGDHCVRVVCPSDHLLRNGVCVPKSRPKTAVVSRRREPHSRAVSPSPPRSGKCFAFNGRQFCE